MVNDKPLTDLVLITLYTCGIKAVVVNIAANKPINSILSTINNYDI